MSEERLTGSSGGTSHGSNAVGSNTGDVTVHNAQGQKDTTSNYENSPGTTNFGDFEAKRDVNIHKPNKSVQNYAGSVTKPNRGVMAAALAMDSMAISVVGQTGGQAGTVVTAGTIRGDELNFSLLSGRGGRRSASKPTHNKSITDYTENDIEALLKKEKFPEEIISKFKKEGIHGEYFINLTDEVLKELGVESALLKMKIKTLINKFSDSISLP